MSLRSEAEIRHALTQMLKCLQGADALEDTDESDEYVTLTQMSTAGIVGALEWALGESDPEGFMGVLESLDRIEKEEAAAERETERMEKEAGAAVTEMPKHRHRE